MDYTREFFQGLQCPTKITWSNDVKDLFTAYDITCMKQVRNIDLGNYEAVKIWATQIYAMVANGTMPPPSSGEPRWPQPKVDIFGCWIQQGMLFS